MSERDLRWAEKMRTLADEWEAIADAARRGGFTASLDPLRCASAVRNRIADMGHPARVVSPKRPSEIEENHEAIVMAERWAERRCHEDGKR